MFMKYIFQHAYFMYIYIYIYITHNLCTIIHYVRRYCNLLWRWKKIYILN